VTIPQARTLERSLFQLLANYPNHFNPRTTITILVGSASKVSLSIFNALGQQVTVLAESYLNPGRYSYAWDASTMASGTYFCRLQAGQYSSTKQLFLIK
jgi:5-hydroxyisourate hydrolase-like protein (transthyretin family)